jgi:hypothetical protein
MDRQQSGLRISALIGITTVHAWQLSTAMGKNYVGMSKEQNGLLISDVIPPQAENLVCEIFFYYDLLFLFILLFS